MLRQNYAAERGEKLPLAKHAYWFSQAFLWNPPAFGMQKRGGLKSIVIFRIDSTYQATCGSNSGTSAVMEISECPSHGPTSPSQSTTLEIWCPVGRSLSPRLLWSTHRDDTNCWWPGWCSVRQSPEAPKENKTNRSNWAILGNCKVEGVTPYKRKNATCNQATIFENISSWFRPLMYSWHNSSRNKHMIVVCDPFGHPPVGHALWFCVIPNISLPNFL